MGFPILTVTESKDGIHVRQDRFLETGPADPKENETLWYRLYNQLVSIQVLMFTYFRVIPLSLLTVDENGKASVDKTAVLDSRESTISIDTTRPFKLNAGTSGVCQ